MALEEEDGAELKNNAYTRPNQSIIKISIKYFKKTLITKEQKVLLKSSGILEQTRRESFELLETLN